MQHTVIILYNIPTDVGVGGIADSTPWLVPAAPVSCGPGWHCAAEGSGSCQPVSLATHPGPLHPCKQVGRGVGKEGEKQ